MLKICFLFLKREGETRAIDGKINGDRNVKRFAKGKNLLIVSENESWLNSMNILN